jgi:hypothetical protein
VGEWIGTQAASSGLSSTIVTSMASTASNPGAAQQVQVEQHADGDEEQPEQDVTERADHRLDLVAVFGLGQHHPGEEGPEGERQPGIVRDPGGAEHHQQHGEGEQLRRRLWAITWNSGRSSQRPAASTAMIANTRRGPAPDLARERRAVPAMSTEASARKGTRPGPERAC